MDRTRSSMRILYHHRTRGLEAQGVHITELVRAFRGLGHAVHVASLARTDGEQEPHMEAKPAAWQGLLRSIPFAHELVQLAYNGVGIPLLLWANLRRPCDLIYERYSLFNFAGIFAARLLRRPVALEVNAPLAFEQARDGHIRAIRFALWTERIICNGATHVFAVSDVLRQMLVANGVASKKVSVIRNGVNLDHFRVAHDGAALRHSVGLDGKVVIGYIGWLRSWHGVPLLIDAFHRSGLASKNVAMLLIGDAQAARSLRQQVDRLGLGHSVVLAGAVPRTRAPEFLSLLDIAVLPAANEYCCPLKILEYMALSKPIVAPRQANVQELVDHGDGAILFAPGDASSLAGALEQLATDLPFARRLGERGRHRIEARRLLWRRNAERVIDIVKGSNGGTETAPSHEPSLALPFPLRAMMTDASARQVMPTGLAARPKGARSRVTS